MRQVFSIIAAFVFCVSTAQAHFIWLDVKPGSDNAPQAQLYFGEQPGPGEPHLIGKVAHTKAWVRSADGEPKNLGLVKPEEKDAAALTAACPQQGATSVEAVCDYGVYSHGGPGFLLQYYAKHLNGDWTNADAKLARAEKLLLDVVPAVSKDGIAFNVLYQGKPAVDKEVIVIDPSEKQHDLKTDSTGKATFDSIEPGRYAVRAAYIEDGKGGERDGKKYSQTWHYTTLTFDVPGTPKAKTAAKAADPNAIDALARARAGRAMWEKFPGFKADITVTAEGKNISGKVSIDPNGAVDLNFPKSEIADWTEEQLASLVQHRMPNGEVSEGNVTWAEEENTHPLGRKIDLGDPKLQSAYRLKDDVIMEVNRTAGPNMRFTISVLEIVHNAEGKYLPRSFTMNFFDKKSGEVKISLAYFNDWQRVGTFDLPKTILEIDTRNGKSTTRQMAFSNYELLK
jgi:uncharacterized GH25 family protein